MALGGFIGFGGSMSDVTASGANVPATVSSETGSAPDGASGGLPTGPSALAQGIGAAKLGLGFLKRGDLGLALGVLAILVVLILPMPAMMLDFLLAISITFSVLVMMTALFIARRSNSRPSRPSSSSRR